MYGQDQAPKKYGLTVPQKKPLPGMRGRPPPATAMARRRPPGSAFSLEDDDSDGEGGGGGDDDLASKASYNKMLQARSLKAQKQLEEAEAAARASDPSIYDYDGVYDTMQAERQARAQAATAAAQEEKKSSRYIDSLKRAAELKKQEQDRFYERRLAKERKEEDELYKDKEVFVTSAYKKKLMEMKKWDTIDKLEEEAAQRREDEAAGKGPGGKEGGKGMDAFYSNLLTKNIAMGADVKTAARSAYTVGSKQQEKAFEEVLPSARQSKKDEDERGAEEEDVVSIKGPSSRMVDSSGEGAKQPKRPRGEEETEQEEGEGAAEQEKRHRAAGAATVPPLPPTPAIREERQDVIAAVTVDPAEAKRQKEEAIRKARERFLARRNGAGSGAGGESGT